ncbi:MAG: hypothetical protein COU51_02765 [Parcubacteria group bacterium CG10_big_fil_rev_8_21_14_0_10_36_14]|nr:MAG: hypothetical protein COU51_02765 [Parcubacteria group bacterium CG10_big_fil_rev_8_21_14_0_10_36_14]
MQIKFVNVFEGNIPIVITVPHDGSLGRLITVDLPIRRPERQNDEGTLFLGADIRDCMKEKFGFRPYLIVQNVERRRLRRYIILNYYEKVLKCVKECLEKWGKCILFDLHAFQHQPVIGNFDIMLGTNHRQTVCGNIDLEFGRRLANWVLWGTEPFDRRNMYIYIPDGESRDGEKFCASKDFTLVKWIKNKEPRSSAIQLEIYKDWFISIDKLRRLAKIISFAIIATSI